MQTQSWSSLAAWLRLQLSPGIGGASMRRLLAAFSLPERVFPASLEELEAVVSRKQARALLQEPNGYPAALETLERWLQAPQHQVVTLADAAYPKALLESPDPPAFLYVACADASWWNRWATMDQAPLLAMVGSRNPTPQGVAHAQSFAQSLSEQGLVIVSGLALGIDAAAHQGALRGSGRTLAVVGTGLLSVYPKQHAALADEIIQRGGAIVSEFPLTAGPHASHFPKRNRIITGLSLGCLVVEASLKSGSLISARLSMEANREVFAIPGSIHAPQYKGCHALIKQGAKLVECVADVLEDLPDGWNVSASNEQALHTERQQQVIELVPTSLQTPTATPTPTLTPNSASSSESPVAIGQAKHALLDWMGYDPIDADALQIRSHLTPSDLQVQLLQLELTGYIQRLPGGQYQRLK